VEHEIEWLKAGTEDGVQDVACDSDDGNSDEQSAEQRLVPLSTWRRESQT
jgi:hypothetical protein